MICCQSTMALSVYIVLCFIVFELLDDEKYRDLEI